MGNGLQLKSLRVKHLYGGGGEGRLDCGKWETETSRILQNICLTM